PPATVSATRPLHDALPILCGYGTGFAATPTGNANSLVTAPAGISYAALINKFTNHEWDNGSWRKSAGVSVQATAENLAAFRAGTDRKSTRLNSSHVKISYA